MVVLDAVEIVLSVSLFEIVACIVDPTCTNHAAGSFKMHHGLAHLVPLFGLNRISYLQKGQSKLLLGKPGEEIKVEAPVLLECI